MIPPPAPPDEAERLASLHGLNILDTPPEERFDRITRISQAVFRVPFCLISLIDAQRQWFKSSQGIAMRELPRETSFCGHAILREEIFHVPDALEDERRRGAGPGPAGAGAGEKRRPRLRPLRRLR